MSIRGENWMKFAEMVRVHVERYTVPQYGDAGADQVTSWTAADCVRQIARYAARFGKNQRGAEEASRDLMKIAHYASLAFEKVEDERDHGSD